MSQNNVVAVHIHVRILMTQLSNITKDLGHKTVRHLAKFLVVTVVL
jgi:hypothetical protein